MTALNQTSGNSVDLDTLEKLADLSHPLTYDGTGIPVTYCIVPRIDVIDVIAELRASRTVVEAARWYQECRDNVERRVRVTGMDEAREGLRAALAKVEQRS